MWYRRRLVSAALVAAAVLAACWPGIGYADEAAGVWPVGSPEILLGHGEPYRGPDGSERTHSGVDIAADAGEVVLAGLAGQVTFAGRVPAGDGTVLAATVLAGDLKLTYMPLADLAVAKGDRIWAGDALGGVATGGDVSSATEHVHVSVRRGSLYIDPLTVLDPPREEAVSGAPTAPGTQAEPPEKPPGPPTGAPVEASPALERPAARPDAPVLAAAAAPPRIPVLDASAAQAAGAEAARARSAAPAAGVEVSIAPRREAAAVGDAPWAAAPRGGSRMRLLRIGSVPLVGVSLPGAVEAAAGVLAAALLFAGCRIPAAGGAFSSPVPAALAVVVRRTR